MQINAVKSNRATQDALDAKQMTPHSNINNINNYSNNNTSNDGNESRQQLQLEAAAVKSKLFAKL